MVISGALSGLAGVTYYLGYFASDSAEGTDIDRF